MSAGSSKHHRSRFRKALDCVTPLLDLSSSASDAFPPLKSAVGGALWIVNAVRGFEANQEEWGSLASYIRQLAREIEEVASSEGLQSVSRAREEQLILVLQEIRAEIETLQAQPSRKQWHAFLKNRTKILDYWSRVERAVGIFSTGTNIATHQAVLATYQSTAATQSEVTELRGAVNTSTDALQATQAAAMRIERLILQNAPTRYPPLGCVHKNIYEPWSLRWFLHEIPPNPAQTVVLFA